ncbi:RagB/SusD family nutrient uptake outer membrane protein [Riemerella anatipestifer]|uniref:RagB/SusD family nutrient uptake outer membrane protein n=1 Tax=Riemerella anatipestifer TaxID=34085 RepID=UPI00137272E2|nr:RagB/SusD family nutrient uptake outer membrane protein [Riemerella anatipestifer]MBT0549911.1 RagB/SusD family nutrient uptake outer membrane protein [Riemerella anatipestifer]MBT0556628.1 RagB/SusD family nutrient uptake outer membrane protein [Riemerella anatipestifer]MBT0560647.1 RagB/SusD family nutrient uptake outer membrane protein [Riemerella anatipestifer]NAV17027.1 RagB/SusD family nutrient uptake outer membrane protein [Riemerella anatipestifer]
MKSTIKTLFIATSLSLGVVSCERYLDIVPTGKVVPQTEEDFRALLTRAYQIYPQHKALLNLKSDEVKAANSSEYLKAIFTWGEANATPGSTEVPYASLYETIFYTNYIIENAYKYVGKNENTNQILGEAYALRAYVYFELIGIYAPAYNGSNGSTLAVPLVTEVNLEGSFPKATLDAVYNQIFSDIATAEQLLNQDKFSAGLNYRFTTTALHAFKARVYQYRKDWANALKEANQVLALNSNLEDFNNFSVLPSSYTSTESIMNLDLPVVPSTYSFSRASDEHIALFDKTNDLRFSKYFKQNGSNWQTLKYNAGSSAYKCTFRVAEVLLIKAEAQAMLDKVPESKATLISLAEKRYNAVGLANFKNKINGLSDTDYYTELLNERARELSFEGLRWQDLRRTNQPEITHIFGGEPFKLEQGDARYTVPFPKEARLKNPEL